MMNKCNQTNVASSSVICKDQICTKLYYHHWHCSPCRTKACLITLLIDSYTFLLHIPIPTSLNSSSIFLGLPLLHLTPLFTYLVQQCFSLYSRYFNHISLEFLNIFTYYNRPLYKSYSSLFILHSLFSFLGQKFFGSY